eukprot:jgi/Mesvir1/22510/Mv18538-RA.2
MEDNDDVQTETGFGSVVVVDNLPVVPEAKYEKLVTVLRKIFSQVGTIRDGGLYVPVDEEKNTKGYAFVEFTSPQEAQAAKETTNGYKLDKSHVFAVNMYDELEKLAAVPEEYAPPPEPAMQSKENLLDWLLDERARDQFVIRYGDETEVYWNDPRKGAPDPVYSRSFWTESFVQWGPRGSFLATLHRPGVALWGGPSWSKLCRLEHHGVRLIDISPAEKFLISCSSHEPSNPRDTQTVTLNIWDCRSGSLLRTFQGSTDEWAVGSSGVNGQMAWPVFKWAGGGEDKYFARIGKNCISVYETATMGLIDKKSIKLDGVHDFSWSPGEPLLCAFVPESAGGNQPARVSLYEVPSKAERRQKNLFSVSDVKIYWQSQGDYLAVQVDRYTKTKKSTYTGFELFRVKERDIPIEVLELENKNEKVVGFAWEPKGHRFIIMHSEGSKPDISIYSMKSGVSSSKVSLMTTLKNKTANQLFFSPQGNHVVFAGLKAMNGQLEFYNLNEMETMVSTEHFMCTDVDWDPTGRFVATSVTSVNQMENGFNIYSYHGKLLYKVRRDRFYQFLWRPRPPTLLSPEKDAEVAKNLRAYSKRYEEEDEAVRAQQDTDLAAERREMLDTFHTWLSDRLRERSELKPEREALGCYSDVEDEYETEVVEVEEIIDVSEEVLYGGQRR